MSYINHPNIQAALFDIDGTLTTGGWIWKPLVSSPDVSLSRKAWLYGTAFPHYGLSKARLVDQAAFRDRWVRLMAWSMQGWPAEQAEAMCERILQEMLVPNLRADVVNTLNQHLSQNHPVILVSTMFDRIVSRLAAHLGATVGLGSKLAIENGTCTGKIIGETCSGGRKVTFAQRYLEQSYPDIGLENFVAYADSGSDIPFLAGVGVQVAVYPDEAMRAAATQSGWIIYGSE